MDAERLFEALNTDTELPIEGILAARNQRDCPCGSGNKFKKCCLSAVRDSEAAGIVKAS